jgi:hypothetical protein
MEINLISEMNYDPHFVLSKKMSPDSWLNHV